MQIKIATEIPITDLRQALFEKLHEIEENYAIRHARAVTLYFIPTNGFGDDIVPRNKIGHEVKKVYSDGPYRSAADDFKI